MQTPPFFQVFLDNSPSNGLSDPTITLLITIALEIDHFPAKEKESKR
jgi:hypothetical protein